MRRATKIRSAGSFDPGGAIDRVVLDADERHRRRIVLTGEQGTQFLLDLDHAVALKDGDGLVLDDGTVVRVAGKPEALIEIEAKSPLALARTPGSSRWWRASAESFARSKRRSSRKRARIPMRAASTRTRIITTMASKRQPSIPLDTSPLA